MEAKKDEKVLLIAGRINADRSNTTLYWKVENSEAKKDYEKKNCDIGDYAIVENMSGYDLALIVGFTETTKQKSKLLTRTNYENVKKAIGCISRNKIESE